MSQQRYHNQAMKKTISEVGRSRETRGNEVGRRSTYDENGGVFALYVPIAGATHTVIIDATPP
eukprot:8721637-Pyramimonas_sp.AAC.1